MCENVFFGSVDRAIFEVDMYNVRVTTEVACWLERARGVKPLNKDTMGEVHEKGSG